MTEGPNGAVPGAVEEALAGRRILVVEDEVVVAMLIEDILTDWGAVVVGPAARVAHALDLLGQGALDAAILDVNVAGETTFAIAQELARRGVPFAFATGYGADGVPPEFAGRPVLAKPFQEFDLGQVLVRTLAGAQGT